AATSASVTTPEPSTFWLLSAMLPLFFLFRSYRSALRPGKPLPSTASSCAFRRVDVFHSIRRTGSLNVGTVRSCAGLLSLPLLPGVARAQLNKTIVAVPGQQTFAVATWYIANCSTVIAVGSYSVNIAPQHGTVSFGGVSGVPPGCPVGGPSLPAAEAN